MRSVLFVLLLIGSQAANADELQFIISGITYHIGEDRDLNETNYGFGLQYDFEPNQRWIPLVNFASFKDSNEQTSKYLGVGLKRRFILTPGPHGFKFETGAAALAMTRQTYRDGKPFLGALPFVSISNNWGGINATYVPKMKDEMQAFWYFQFSLKMATY